MDAPPSNADANPFCLIEADYGDVGRLCLNILADIGSTGPSKFFFASGGTVTLTSHTPPVGTLSGVTMIEVTSGGAEIQGGCTSAIDAMTFSTN